MDKACYERGCACHDDRVDGETVEVVAKHELDVLRAKIETLYAMYELASKQRDYLMEQQNAQVAAMRGRMQ
jgi:hypothetical protein